ncbi:ATP-binding cassette domain-containing protein [Streptomyces sp. CA-251387]|uniref:ATP-binding cassette domain-containing protein n=1 Tax=Streptomyces sp. CA-251387 TaxID=3240064 RepID=UPI003D90FFB9
MLDVVGLDIAGGAKVAVVGHSGAGKSALAAVVGHLLTPDSGDVLLDGVPVRTLAPDARSRAVVYAFARPEPLGRTVRDDITYGLAPGAAGRAESAARAACADNFIERLPDGYGTALTGLALSGGERQRLGLARAAARMAGARVLVLDDATSHLDTVTELLVGRALRTDGTQIVITHRAATAARADTVGWLQDDRYGRSRPTAACGRCLPTGRSSPEEWMPTATGPPTTCRRRRKRKTMSDRARGGKGWRLLWEEIRGRRGALLRLTAWSGLEALPALVTGFVVARALDDGFLAQRPVAGAAWLAVLGVALVCKAAAARAVFAPLCDVVEPLRDGLTRRLVTATVRRAVAAPRTFDASAVAQLTGHIDTVRALTSALLRSVLRMALTVVGALAGALTVAPVVGLIVGPTLLIAVLAFCKAIPAMARRRYAVFLADEAVSWQAGTMVAGVRDIAAAGAYERAAADVVYAAERHARATRAAARTDAIRIAVIMVGCHLPLLALLASAPWLVRRDLLTVGELVSATACLTAGIEPALRAVTSLLGAWGLQLGVAAHRLQEAIADGPLTAVPPHTPPGGTAVRIGHQAQCDHVRLQCDGHARGTGPESDHPARRAPRPRGAERHRQVDAGRSPRRAAPGGLRNRALRRCAAGGHRPRPTAP